MTVIPFRTTIDGEGHRLELDGHDIARQVAGFTLAATGRHTPTITLHMYVGDLDVNFPEANVEIDPATHKLLVRLGWQPPDSP